MYHSNQRSDEAKLAMTRRLGLPDGVGTHMITESDGTGRYHGAIRQRFGDILSGGLKNKIDSMDGHDSTLFMAPSRINMNDEFGNGGRTRAALSTREHFPARDRRMHNMRGQQQKVSKPEYSVELESFNSPSMASDSSDFAQIEALFGGRGASQGGGYSPTGPLLPERGYDSSMSLGDGYATGIPYDPVNHIRNKLSSGARNTGVDYRELENRASSPTFDEVDSRYLNQLSNRNQSVSDPHLMQEMARNMADQMIRTFMEENRGKQYFKEVKTTHKFDNPKSRLVEIDGKFYRMELTQVKFKRGKHAHN